MIDTSIFKKDIVSECVMPLWHK